MVAETRFDRDLLFRRFEHVLLEAAGAGGSAVSAATMEHVDADSHTLSVSPAVSRHQHDRFIDTYRMPGEARAQ